MKHSGVKRKIAFLGNPDNFGIRHVLWLRKLGYDACLYRSDEGKRGDITHYYPDYALNKPDWIRPLSLNYKEFIQLFFFPKRAKAFFKEINENFDCVWISGPMALVLSKFVHLPKLFIPVGYEVSYFASKRNRPIKYYLSQMSPIMLLKDTFVYRQVKQIIYQMTLIVDWFECNLDVYRELNLIPKVKGYGVGDDCAQLKTLADRSLKEEILLEYQNCHRTLLWFSRLNFTNPEDPIYKGVEIFYEALEGMLDYLKDNKIRIIMGFHGEDKEAFYHAYGETELYQYIDWIGHLDYPQLISYLSIPNAIAFTDFGKYNTGISGIMRDALSMGVPIINNSAPEVMEQQYEGVAPRLYADNPVDIRSQIKSLSEMSDEEFNGLKAKTYAYALEHLNYDVYIARLEQAFEQAFSS